MLLTDTTCNALAEVESQMRGAWYDRGVMLAKWRNSKARRPLTDWSAVGYYRVELDCIKKRLRGLRRIRQALKIQGRGIEQLREIETAAKAVTEIIFRKHPTDAALEASAGELTDAMNALRTLIGPKEGQDGN